VVPTWVRTTLYSDVDDDERLVQETVLGHPLGE